MGLAIWYGWGKQAESRRGFDFGGFTVWAVQGFHLLQRYITQHESILDCCKWQHRQSLDFFGLKTLSYVNMWMAV